MAGIINRSVARALRPAHLKQLSLRKMPKRFHGDMTPEEAAADAASWLKISIGAVAGCVVCTAYVAYVEYEHSQHHTENPERPYKAIRTRPFAWRCDQCALFDMPCWAECAKK